MQDPGDKIEPIWPMNRDLMIAEINSINQVLPIRNPKERNLLMERVEILTLELEKENG